MQEVELGLIVASIFAIVLGAIVVLVPRTDLIPDGVEPFLWILVGLIASGLALIALSVGFARR